MSLKAFHIFFIAISTLLGLLLLVIGRQSNPLLLYTGITLLILLIPYGAWFLKKMKHISVILLALLLTSPTLWACPACYGNTTSSDSSILATKIGVIFLGVVISGILSSIAFTAYTWSRRARQQQIG